MAVFSALSVCITSTCTLPETLLKEVTQGGSGASIHGNAFYCTDTEKTVLGWQQYSQIVRTIFEHKMSEFTLSRQSKAKCKRTIY